MPDTRPLTDGALRHDAGMARRAAATELSFDREIQPVPSNGEEDADGFVPVTNFSKGLKHDAFGLAPAADYEAFVDALADMHLNASNISTFDVPSSHRDFATANPGLPNAFRQWESPLAGLYYSIEGADPAALSMAPAPKLGLSELCAEMAEVYAFAILRDTAFDGLTDPNTPLTYVDIADPSTVVNFTYPAGHPKQGQDPTLQDLRDEMAKLSFLDPAGMPFSSVTGALGLNGHETARRVARWDSGGDYTVNSMFRGSAPGADVGPQISQFMLLGTAAPKGLKTPTDGEVRFGAQSVSQRLLPNTPGVDFMSTWDEWLEVQNGRDTRGELDPHYLDDPRFVTTPRDLATYVHFDQLYQAYFNACLILLENGVAPSPGFPNSHPTASRGPFATFGGPHVLSLLTEVATRGLKAVRRQKFQIHRRARPEVIAARLTQAANGAFGAMPQGPQDKLTSMLNEYGAANPADDSKPGVLLHWIAELNKNRAGTKAQPGWMHPHKNYLLPMAFPEGSPMHPAYGAGHATVAGACVTVLKAFFDMAEPLSKALGGATHFHTGDPGDPTNLKLGDPLGTQTIEGELNKLAANISIGRNMAGVHYYSDYYDSLRLGERIAASIIEEQMLNYNEAVSMSFNSFDGDAVHISTAGGDGASNVTFTVIDTNGLPIHRDTWLKRHVADYIDPGLA
ncbi:vanadium-dependent haloperoxidase [Gymnodinialimonas sp. 2305UL16-5]|uniref:vanadium-dependent haloperoxidase n=1 Tax=Gymnodinialimonas mytili TaxID=3126503 RepID=UPI0030A84D9D